MLALVKTPLTEISIHGDGAIEIIEYLKSKFTVTVLSVAPEEKSDDELVDLTSTEWWKENKRRALAGYRLKKQLTQKELARLSGIRQSVISEYETGKREITTAAAIKLAPHLGIKASSLILK